MRKVPLVHISSSGCCNTLVTMLNNGDFGFPYCATPAFSTPAVWCHVFQSRVFLSRVFSRPVIYYVLCKICVINFALNSNSRLKQQKAARGAVALSWHLREYRARGQFFTADIRGNVRG